MSKRPKPTGDKGKKRRKEEEVEEEEEEEEEEEKWRNDREMSEELQEPDESSGTKELVIKLTETGLNPEKWRQVLLEKLGIRNIQSLQYIKAEDCSILEDNIRYPWEKRALHKLFNIPDSSVQIAEAQEKRCQSLKNKTEQAAKILMTLKELSSEGKSRQDEIVKHSEEEMWKALEIPTECSAPSEKPLVDLVDYFENQIKLREESYLKRENLCEEDLIKYASGGLALEGIFQTKSIEDVFRKYEPLLCVSEGFNLVGPEQKPVLQEKEFTSHEEESKFQKCVEKIGLSLNSSISIGFMGFGLNISIGSRNSSESYKFRKESSEQTYVCTIRYNYIPLASCYFTTNQLRLSQAALNALKDIETLIDINTNEQILAARCAEFFQKFGSHANLGPIHFGGIYWWKASMQGISTSQLQEAKQMTSEALNVYMGVSYAGSGGDIGLSKTNTQGIVNRPKISTFQKNIQLSVTKTGGPPEADSLSHWKSGLVCSSKTWSVIDRGFQLIPIWKIIIDNHKNEFKDSFKLASCLINHYTSVTGLSSEMMVGEHLVTEVKKTKLFLQGVKSWNVDNSKEHLQKLIDFKQTLNETTGSYSAWVTLCLSDKGLQEYLVNVVKKYKDSSEQDTYLIKVILQQLIEPHIYSVDNFPNASFIMRWIFDSEKDELDHISVTNFKDLIDVFQSSMEDVLPASVTMKTSTEEHQQAKVKATVSISLSLYSFLRTMRNIKQTDTELLFLCIANNSGYCIENNNFRDLLEYNDIKFLENQMQEAYEEYTNLRSQCAQRAQAFVLYTGLTSVGQYKEISLEQKRKRLHFMKKHLAGCLSPNVNEIFENHSEYCDWSKMEAELRAFSYGHIIKELKTDEIANELNNVCQEEVTYMTNDVEMECNNINTQFLQLLRRLDLDKYYPQKMKTGDFHKICRSSLSETQILVEKQLAFHFLQKLLMLDYRARYVQCRFKGDPIQEKNSNEDNNMDTCEDTFEDFLGDFSEDFKNQRMSNKQTIHPMDVQMAIFHCANDFMRQYMYTKLSLCQFAVPLLVTNPNTNSIEFPLWSFQEVKKKWKSKSTENKENYKSNDRFVKETEIPIVSFIRLGPSTSSKSQIINWLMSRQKHDIFYHRHCKGSTKNSVLMNGVTEIAWYCPGGKEDDAFDDCIAFTNLHGDARDHDQQVKFLKQISSVLVVMFTDSDAKDAKGKEVLEQLWNSSIPLIGLLADKEHSQPTPRLRKKIGIKNRNEAELLEEVTTTIQSLLHTLHLRYSLNKCGSIAKDHGFMVDEYKEQCQQGREQAEVLISILKKNNVSDMKNEFFPSQGDLWHMWCMKDKELNRLKKKNNKSIEQQRSDIESQKHKLRNEQVNKAFPLNDFMRSFLQTLHSNVEFSKVYFLQWVKMYLDDLSSNTLSVLYQEYHNVWSNVEKEKQKGKNKTTIEKMRKDLEKLSMKINMSTFGLEHILRELGQIYEALETISKVKSFSHMPKIVANLMVSGYPVELMDGDAAHVPLRWIQSILDELIKILGDKKLYVLSVLGIQSTGKSTLLNAMFGLQFAVSAGRCTRGAFMQLIEVDEELRHEMTFDYVLVVDTEGLRAVELSNKNALNHDNELATFVIGLGNLTVINIFGENPSEMQDILQIAVQAFLRMKRVNLQPSCLFVHQNVGEITAKEKNMEGRRKLQEKLDEMTLCAAQQEQCDVTCFNDVIKFDVNTHIHYFAHLWAGDPPMAPPNPSYSQNVQTLRQVILDSAKQEAQHNILSISMFKTRVNDLWNALLNENFVFSFKNSLEIAAYNKLEVKYSQWAWTLREHMLTLQNKINNQIHNDKIKSVDVMFLNKEFPQKYNTIMEDLKIFFNDEKDRDILAQWKVNTEQRLATIKDDLIVEIRKKADELITLKKDNRKINKIKDKYEEQMLAESRKMALTLRGKILNDEDLLEKFNKMWNMCISGAAAEMRTTEPPPIKQHLENVFLERFKQETDLADTIRNSYKWTNLVKEFSNYISTKSKIFMLDENLSAPDQKKIVSVTRALHKRISEYIGQKLPQIMDYQLIYFHEILNILNTEVTSMLGSKFKYKREYTLYVSLFLCQKAARRFIQINDAFRKANDPLAYLQSKREQFWQSFKISCEGTIQIASLADYLCNTIKDSVQQGVYEKSAIQLSGDMRSNYPALNGNRSKLEFCLLKSLAEKENFQDYMNYINDPKSAVRAFIGECIDQYYDNKTKISVNLHINVDHFRNIIIKAIDTSTVMVTDRRGDVSSWLDAFCSGLGSEVNLSSADLKSVKYQNITDIDFLKEAMTKAMEIVEKDLKHDFSKCDLLNMKEKILEILFRGFQGCWKKCPFCGAVCTNTIAGHDGKHSVKFHRPRAIEGGHWRKTDHFAIDICSTLVSTDIHFYLSDESDDKHILFKTYSDAGPPHSDWSITPDNSSLSYWKWVICHFQSDLEKHYKLRFTDKGTIPSQWKSIEKQDVILELDKQM
ncbi:interferon-induced very large GTPase 1-like isoform X1 [Pseudophryne corroboree]|uniref:interferon-induced very large GTPase 1-like isoform X1 n=1 Tax=Pseudophryne corroboree TaxID=495146 RepID=UPI00308207CF